MRAAEAPDGETEEVDAAGRAAETANKAGDMIEEVDAAGHIAWSCRDS